MFCADAMLGQHVSYTDLLLRVVAGSDASWCSVTENGGYW
jgi:hypothetical protein